jgi:hypothetical protein
MIKNKTTFAGPTPACFDTQQQYHEWKVLASRSFDWTSRRLGPCVDCTPEFKGKMRAAKRCENPEIRFDWVKVKISKKHYGEELQGYLPTQKELDEESQHV